MKIIDFITGNDAKFNQVKKLLDYPVKHVKIDLEEIQSLDPEKIIEHKAKEAFKYLKTPVLVEDTSLTFKALGKLPGPFIKWFQSQLSNKELCELVDGLKIRDAMAEVVLGLYDGKNLKIFRNKVKGSIANRPAGKNYFGWNQIFIPKGHNKTFAQMAKEEFETTSLRKPALRKLEKYLLKEKSKYGG